MLLIIAAVIKSLLILTGIAQLAFPAFTKGQEATDNAGGLAASISYAALTLLSFVVFVITAVVFLMWLHRVCSNLPAFGHWKSGGYSPGWAVGSFFVPLGNLAMPYQAVKEIWQKSRPANSQSFSFSSSPPGFFPAWWGFWLTSNFALNIHFRMSKAEFRDARIIIGIIASALSITAAAFAIEVIKEIVRRQEETIAHVRPNEQFPVPPPPPIFDAAAGPTV